MRNLNVEVNHRLLGLKDLGIPLEGRRARKYLTSMGLSAAAAVATLMMAAFALRW